MSFKELAEEYEQFVSDSCAELNSRDFGQTVSAITAAEAALKERSEAILWENGEKAQRLLGVRRAEANERARPSAASIEVLREEVARASELAGKALARAKRRAEASAGDQLYEAQMEARRREREERRQKREEERRAEEEEHERKRAAKQAERQKAMAALGEFGSRESSGEEMERQRRAKEQAERVQAERRREREMRGNLLERHSYGLVDQSGVAARDQTPIDVEQMMAARREAQIKAQERVKEEKTRRAQEEKKRKAENEALDMNLPHLMIVKGVENPRAVMVAPRAASLTTTDHFILHTETHIFHYKAEKASLKKLKHAVGALAKIRKERLSKVKVVSMKYNADQPMFWKALGGKRDVTQEGISDEAWENKQEVNTRLYRFDKDVGLMPETNLSYTTLTSDSCFVLLTSGEFYLWFGRNTGLNLRKLTEQRAQDDFAYEVPKWVNMTTVVQGEEKYLFYSKFPDWVDLSKEMSGATPKTRRKKATKAHIGKMLTFNPDLVPIIDDVYGTTEVWLVTDYAKTPVPQDQIGQFFSGSSYICLYTGAQGTVLYFWKGSKSPIHWSNARESIHQVQEKVANVLDPGTPKLGRGSQRSSRAFNAPLAINPTKKKAESLPVMRLLQGDEPPHFLGIFRGKMLIRNGQADSFEANVNVLSMFHVRGSNMFNTRTVECSPTAELLNSDDCFVVHGVKSLMLWKGEKTPSFLYEVAQHQAKALDSHAKCIQVHETLEPPHFWKKIGGKKEYFRSLDRPKDRMRPRLFIYDGPTGNITPKASVLFSHLRPRDSVILDTFDDVFVWHGISTIKKEHFFAHDVAEKFLEQADDDREKNSVIEVHQGSEPPNFKRWFQGWMNKEKPSEKKSELDELTQKYRKTFTLAQLQDKERLPLTLNRKTLEMYLSDEEFQKVFGMPIEIWQSQPAWKRTQSKEKAGLF